jgi:hypothetical protein
VPGDPAIFARAATKFEIINGNWHQASSVRDQEKKLLGWPETRGGRFGRAGSCSRGM